MTTPEQSPKQTERKPDTARLRRWTTYASVGVSSTLILTKLGTYLATDSVAILSSLLDSTVDLIASLVTMWGVASALRPPDKEHRFGHGKAEALAALAQAAFIIGSSVFLSYEALNRLYHPREISHEELGYGVMVFAIVMTLLLLAFQRYTIRRTNSMAIDADHLHYTGDVGINVAVIVALGLYQWTGLAWFDPLFAVLIAGKLILTAWHVAAKALNVLMDRELPDEAREQIRDLVCRHPSVRGVHDMRTRSDSDRVFIEMHVEMDGNINLTTAHKVGEDLVDGLRKIHPNADIMIHQDPAGIKEDRLDEKLIT
ncbi:MAG: cation diffusion facilitator family transporter [Bdellovibrionales bacterium]